MKDENSIFIEIGPGNSLSMLLSQFPVERPLTTFTTLRHPKQSANDVEFFFKSIASFWINGGTLKWESIYSDEERYRVPLPSYPFERRRHWIDPKTTIPIGQIIHTKGQEYGAIPDSGLKLDTTESALSELYHTRPLLDNKFTPPESKIEKGIAGIWEESLGIKGIGITDNFFHLGGHSLLASQILNRINEELNSEITIENFFNFPSIKGLVDNCTFAKAIGKVEIPSPKIDYSSPLPLSKSQERLWIINQIDNNTPAYNISFSFILKGILDKKIFHKSLGLLFDRHKILKSYIRKAENHPVIIINNDREIKISELDFSKYSVSEEENKIQEFLENESQTKFDIENGPLYRIYFLNLGIEETLFHFTVHHLIFDGWSWGIFAKELKEIYNSLLKGEILKLEPLSFNYFEYAVSESQEAPDKRYLASKEYWTRKLTGITGQLNFPLDYMRSEVSTGKGGRVAVNIGKTRAEKLRVFSKKEDVTLYMFILSAFGLILSRYSGDNDICIGSPTANRSGSRLEKLIGLFINSIVLRLQIDEELSFSDLLRTVKNITIEALSNQELPFEDLVKTVQPERILNRNPIFQVMFAWQNTPRPPLSLEGIRPERYFQKNGVSPLDITFYAWEEDESILGEIEFSSDILKRATIESFRDNFLYLLDQIVTIPDVPLKAYSIISDPEKARQERFNNTLAIVPEVPLHSLFERNIDKYADKTAVYNLSTRNNLKYTDLEKEANKVAHFLGKRGVKPGDIIGISMNRSESMVIAVLGILKAGGTYLPLDPVFPDDRLLYMLEDSGAKALITEEAYNERFSRLDRIKIIYDSEKPEIDDESIFSPGIKINTDALAYIIYTSGSTGKPKGVRVHHHAVVNFINSMSKVPGIASADKLLAVTTLSFDISVLELFLPLSYGATVYIADNEHIADGENAGRDYFGK